MLGRRPGIAHLAIDDAPARRLALLAVDGDRCVECARSDGAPAVAFAVMPGAYVVRVESPDGAVDVPAPVLEPLLGSDRTLRVSLADALPPHPRPDAGDFAWIPGGPALVGDELGVGQEDERPPRLVSIPGFWLGRREVTNAEYAAFLAAATTVDAAWCAFDSRKCRLQCGTDGRWTTAAPDQPVVTVSLAGARAYCAWRTRATGVHHRLPHEAEWEKAARGPQSFTFAYGNVYRRAAANQESGALHEVARHAPNGWGLFDLTGNAFEWTDDVYDARAGGSTSGTEASFQVLRGGSFVLDGMYLRNSFRMRQRPDVRTDDIGFRVLREHHADTR